MKNFLVLMFLFTSLAVIAGCGPTVDLEAEKIELLRIHLADIQAHLDGDVAGLMKTIPEDFTYVGDGEITRQSRQEIEDFFTGYLAGAEYKHYEDLQVPHAEVSADGTMGWVISRMGVMRREPDGSGGKKLRSFTYAGIMTYEKVGGQWMKVANVSTFEP